MSWKAHQFGVQNLLQLVTKKQPNSDSIRVEFNFNFVFLYRSRFTKDARCPCWVKEVLFLVTMETMVLVTQSNLTNHPSI